MATTHALGEAALGESPDPTASSDVDLGARGDATSTAAGTLTARRATASQALGHASVSGQLSVRQVLSATAGGVSSATGRLAWDYTLTGASAGTATCQAHLSRTGELEAAATGVAVVGADLEVKRYRLISGTQTPDSGPSGTSRDSGSTRVRFTPRSTGHTNSVRLREKAR